MTLIGVDKLKYKSCFILLIGQSRELHQKISGIYLRIFSTRIDTGELLILAVSGDNNSFAAYEAFELYRKRWSIETMFKAFKSSGFNFEDTHLSNLERLHKMMVLLTIAFSWAIRIGEIKIIFNLLKLKFMIVQNSHYLLMVFVQFRPFFLKELILLYSNYCS